MNQPKTYCNGQILIDLAPFEARPSHWVDAPKVMRPDGAVLVDLTQTFWDLQSVAESPAEVALTLRRYPGDRGSAVVRIVVASGEIDVEGELTPAPEVVRCLEAHYQSAKH
ncbi:hypothetical protein K6V72_16710 [Ralstonia insidiosa]|uniref:Uncharacterized protein n=1 Tax=Ralstonia insidiosa TaxID=190721 RepID=A0A192A4H5_9RALS|nr:hypothetical protein [Ralstonia insidiosa]ANJ75289.1 hypothetical protein A9Y76_22510 [Ralstonia insidiosa]KAB0467976.1 hypothetical protein F7R11_22245 [Ralstonia insidiosa]MBY4910655.1 hypothetical protein [Ralstonia insidiosa]